MPPPTLLYGWNPSSGRVYHHLTGRRTANGRPLTACGRTVKSATGGRPEVGYVECNCCRVARGQRPTARR